MILRNSLYKILEADRDSEIKSYRIGLNSEHVIYRAHFPGEPVTPGVCIMQIAQELLADLTGRDVCLNKIKNAKFTAVMSPVADNEAVAEFTKINIEENQVSAQCFLYNHNKSETYAKLSFTCNIK